MCGNENLCLWFHEKQPTDCRLLWSGLQWRFCFYASANVMFSGCLWVSLLFGRCVRKDIGLIFTKLSTSVHFGTWMNFFTFWGQKVKVQGHSVVQHAGECTFWPCDILKIAGLNITKLLVFIIGTRTNASFWGQRSKVKRPSRQRHTELDPVHRVLISSCLLRGKLFSMLLIFTYIMLI